MAAEKIYETCAVLCQGKNLIETLNNEFNYRER